MSIQMTSREVVKRAVRFEGPDRIPMTLAEGYPNDIAWVGMTPSPDARRQNGVDEWGAVWHNIGVCQLGEVKEFPLKDWADFDKLPIPDIHAPHRWETLPDARDNAGDKFLMGNGISLYERAHFIRGLENVWMDIHVAPDELGQLLDILVEMNLVAIEKYAAAGADGYMFCDDWGLQDRLMIQPADWRRLWKPRYARVYGAAHDAGLLTFLHSCGHITAILDDLIEAGLDVIQMDQQENMGLEALGDEYRGRIAFWCPVDIQNTMTRGTTADIRDYALRMVRTLGTPDGGFIAKWYGDPKGAGHTPEAITAMCDAFVEASDLLHA